MTTKPKQTCTQCGKDSADKTGYCAECDYTNMPKQAHTPTPYTFKDQTATYQPHIIKSGEEVIARLCGPVSMQKSNASFIVRACNRDHLFEELLEACKFTVSKMSPGSFPHLEKAIANAEKGDE